MKHFEARGAFRVFRVFRGHVFLLAVLLTANDAYAQYYPSRDNWERRTPEQLGFDPAKLQAAVDYAKNSDSGRKTDMAAMLASIANEPEQAIIGPIKERGGVSGLIIRKGYIAAEWGDTRTVDMTFSVTKSYLSTVAALAFDDGLLRSTRDTV